MYKGFTCNLFEMKTLTCVSNNGILFDENIFYNISMLEPTGMKLLNEFIQDRSSFLTKLRAAVMTTLAGQLIIRWQENHIPLTMNNE